MRLMTLRMNNPMLVPSVQAREVVEQQQGVFRQSWDPLFVGYSAAAYFHSSEIKLNSWTTEAKKMRCSMPRRCDVPEVNKVLERAGFENQNPIYDECRLIVEEGYLGLMTESTCSTRKHLAPPYGLEEVELYQKVSGLKGLALFMCPSRGIRSLAQSHPRLCRMTILETREISQ